MLSKPPTVSSILISSTPSPRIVQPACRPASGRRGGVARFDAPNAPVRDYHQRAVHDLLPIPELPQPHGRQALSARRENEHEEQGRNPHGNDLIPEEPVVPEEPALPRFL